MLILKKVNLHVSQRMMISVFRIDGIILWDEIGYVKILLQVVITLITAKIIPKTLGAAALCHVKIRSLLTSLPVKVLLDRANADIRTERNVVRYIIIDSRFKILMLPIDIQHS